MPMLTEYRIPIGTEQVRALEEAGEEMGEWFLFHDALEGRDYLSGYFDGECGARAQLERVNAMLAAPLALENAETGSLEERDWREAYKDHFKSWRFGGLHWVPAWERERFSVPEGEEVIWLDPGMAFGTGNHETTRLCVERLVALLDEFRSTGREPETLSVLDVGSGSGILALSAAKLGFGRVAGFDNDAEAVAVSRENAGENALGDRVVFSVAGLPDGVTGRSADLVMANIQSDILCRYAGELWAAVNPGGALVMSGILAHEADGVRERFLGLGKRIQAESRTLGEWAEVALRRVG